VAGPLSDIMDRAGRERKAPSCWWLLSRVSNEFPVHELWKADWTLNASISPKENKPMTPIQPPSVEQMVLNELRQISASIKELAEIMRYMNSALQKIAQKPAA
jgi:hypothetical protein